MKVKIGIIENIRKYVIDNYIILNNRDALCDYISKIYLANKSKAFCMIVAYDLGIVEIIFNNNDDEFAFSKISMKMESQYAMDSEKVKDAINEWRKVFDLNTIKEIKYKKILDLNNSYLLNHSNSIPNLDKDFLKYLYDNYYYMSENEIYENESNSYVQFLNNYIFDNGVYPDYDSFKQRWYDYNIMYYDDIY